MIIRWILAAAILLGWAPQPAYDVVLVGGRVMDPESGLDGVRNVGIRDGKIAVISEAPLTGATTIDAHGLVVAPGFIDLHEHGQAPRNYQFQAHDGVTTSLELERGTDDVAGWYAAREGKSLINFGVSIGHIAVRMRILHDSGGLLPTGAAARLAATPEQLDQMRAAVDRGFREGALAEGMGVNTRPRRPIRRSWRCSAWPPRITPRCTSISAMRHSASR